MHEINIKDLQSLNHSYHENSSSLHIIYGANKSGKTTFLKDFVVKKDYIYLSCTNTSKHIQVSNFAKIISDKFKQKYIQSYFNQFEDILILLDKQTIKEKLVVIFDDFHNLLKVNKDELNILLSYWDKKLQYKNIQIILTSSNIFDKSKHKKLLSYEKNIFFIEDIPFLNIKKKKNLSIIDKLHIYSFFGSSDYLINYYNPKEEFIKNVYKIALVPSSPFFNYGFDYLKENISDISTYNAILYAISKDNNKISQIASFINLPASYLSRYIQKLIDLMIISRVLPINDNFKNSKNGRYFINDHFLKFWYCYIFENLSFLQMKKHSIVIKQIDSSYIKNILEPTYKKYILNLIKQNPVKYLGYNPYDIAPWWDNNNSIDLVAYDEHNITFINIFWENVEVVKNSYKDLQENANNYKTSLKRNYIIISKNSYLKSMEN
jgi:hypothetical protein